MKQAIKFVLLAVVVSSCLWACNKQITEVTYESSTAPVLTTSRIATIPLAYADSTKEAIKLMWTNPNYQFTTGLSSQNVSYKLEIDTTGANFTNPSRKVLSFSKDLSISITTTELNDYLLNQLQLKAGVVHNIEMRVTAALTNNAIPLASNVVKFTATPFAIPPKVTPPGTPVGNPATDWVNGQLFIVGDATTGGWNNPVPEPAQKLTKVSSTFYTITLPLVADKSYLLLPVNGSWNAKFGGTGANNSNDPLSFDFKDNGGDIKAPSASGNYRVEVDFQRGKVTVTKL